MAFINNLVPKKRKGKEPKRRGKGRGEDSKKKEAVRVPLQTKFVDTPWPV